MTSQFLLVLVAVLALNLMPANARADTGSAPKKISYPDEGVDLGAGWDSLEARKTSGSCIAFSKNQRTPPQSSATLIQRVVDRYTFDKAIDLSAEMKMQEFLGGGGSAKAKYSENTAIASDRTNFLLTAWVANQAEFVEARAGEAEIYLLPELAQLAKSNPAAFRQRCGDHFVSSLWTGAELYGFISFETDEEKVRQALSAEFEASGFLLSGGASFSQVLNKYQKSSRWKLTYFQSGGSGEPIPADEAGFIRAASDLRTAAQRAPKGMAIAIRPYTEIKGWPSDDPIGSPPSDYDRLVAKLAEANRLYENLGAVIRKTSDYSVGFPKTLQQLKDWQDEVQRQIVQYKQDLRNCVEKKQRAACGQPITESEITRGILDSVDLPVSNKSVVDKYSAPAVGCDPFSRPCVTPPPKLVVSYHPTAVAMAVYQLRIEELSRGYCGVDKTHLYCLSNATKKKWRDYIFQRLGLPVPSELPFATNAVEGEIDHPQALPPNL